MDHEEKYGNPCYANVRTRQRIFIKKCAIGVMINTLLASSYCPSFIVTVVYIHSEYPVFLLSKAKTQIDELLNSCTIDCEAMATMIPVLRRGTIEFLSPTCGPDEYCPVLTIGSSRQKNAPHLMLSKSIFSRIHRISGVSSESIQSVQ
ncbi:hypothetical protein ALC60_12190 [Trachymyrmex zeteki]|uniref:Uncharacterized protein n=1 Tax=Mycetomoellerius zeteki TaxID=64791 RepID=A0A151WLW2_9HYME|nr:hypothetical protein ALC60_12190 [Trachymyrmex zeteki]